MNSIFLLILKVILNKYGEYLFGFQRKIAHFQDSKRENGGITDISQGIFCSKSISIGVASRGWAPSGNWRLKK